MLHMMERNLVRETKHYVWIEGSGKLKKNTQSWKFINNKEEAIRELSELLRLDVSTYENKLRQIGDAAREWGIEL